MYYLMTVLEIYAIKLLLNFSKFRIVIICINYMPVLNFLKLFIINSPLINHSSLIFLTTILFICDPLNFQYINSNINYNSR